MRLHTKILGIICLICFMLFVWFQVGCKVSVKAACVITPASSDAAELNTVTAILNAGTALEQYSTDFDLQDTDNLYIAEVTLTLRNRTPIDAKWVEVECTAIEGDIMLYSVESERNIVPAHGTTTVKLKYLTHADGTEKRACTVSYYTFGKQRIAKKKA